MGKDKQELLIAKGDIVSFIIFLPVLLIALFTTLLFLRPTLQLIFAQSWIPVEAEIEKVELLSRPSSGGRGGTSSKANLKIEVLYKYSFKEKNYQGKRLNFTMRYTSLQYYSYKSLYRELRNAKKVRIYINSNQPEEATILRGASWVLIIIGLTNTAFVLLSLLVYRFDIFKQIFQKRILHVYLITIVIIYAILIYLHGLDLSRQLDIIK